MVYSYGAVSIADGCFDRLVLPHVNGQCMRLFLNEIAQHYSQKKIITVLDGAGWRKNQAMVLTTNLKLQFLPPYSPELNPVEHLWDELREKNFHNRAFETIDAVDDTVVAALRTLELDQARVLNICQWDWIINAISIAK